MKHLSPYIWFYKYLKRNTQKEKVKKGKKDWKKEKTEKVRTYRLIGAPHEELMIWYDDLFNLLSHKVTFIMKIKLSAKHSRQDTGSVRSTTSAS